MGVYLKGVISWGRIIPNTHCLLGYLLVPNGGKLPGSEIQENKIEAGYPACSPQHGKVLQGRLPGGGGSWANLKHEVAQSERRVCIIWTCPAWLGCHRQVTRTGVLDTHQEQGNPTARFRLAVPGGLLVLPFILINFVAPQVEETAEAWLTLCSNGGLASLKLMVMDLKGRRELSMAPTSLLHWQIVHKQNKSYLWAENCRKCFPKSNQGSWRLPLSLTPGIWGGLSFPPL